MMAEKKKSRQGKARLIGVYESIIKKYRVGLGRFHQCFGDTAVAVRMADHLVLLTLEQFDIISSGVQSKTSYDSEENVYKFFDTEIQPFQRYFYANAYEVNIDEAGRFTIPAKIYDKLQLSAKVTWVGCGDRLELWNQEKYNEQSIIWEHEGGPARAAGMLSAPRPPAVPPDSDPGGNGARDQE